MYIRKQRLLTPGPTPLYPPALHAMLAADIHHRTDDFRKVYRNVLAGLKEVYGTQGDVLCFGGSGTGAMEASVSNLFSEGDKVIVCSAGSFGERWVGIAKAFGLDAHVVSAEYGNSVSPEQVAEALKASPDAKGVFIQASESSTGAEHDLQAIGEMVKQTDAVFVVDAITGLGTMPLNIDGWGLDIVIGGSQKAFMIPPGLSFLSVSAKAWKKTETAKLRHFYFDLKKEKKSGEAGEATWTPVTAMVLAMSTALDYIRQIGMPNLVRNAQMLANAARAAVGAVGLELFAKHPASSLTAVRPPGGMDSGVIVKAFRDRFGAIIADGQGVTKGKIFRIAHLGYFDFPDLVGVIAGLELILRANGRRVELGSGVAAAAGVYERMQEGK
jgi:aspartate aminotransferase-like enzyme